MDFLSHSFPLPSVPSPVEPGAVVQNFKFTRNCLLRGLFCCRLLGSCLLGGGFFGGRCRCLRCLLRTLLRCRSNWRRISCCADAIKRLLLSNSDDDVCEPALVAEGAA